MNKARMTFRFDEEQGHQLEDKKDRGQLTVAGSASQNPAWADDRNSGSNRRDVETKRTPISAVPASMQGWSDPFNREDSWERLEERMGYGIQERADDTPEHDSVADGPDHRYPDSSEDWDLDRANNRYTVREGYDAYDHIENRPDEAGPGPIIEEYSYRPHRPGSIWKVVGTVTGAIVTGALFGLVVLSFFKDGSAGMDPGGNTGNPSAVRTSAQSGEDQASVPAVAVEVGPQTYYMLQYGVFSTADRVQQAKDELEQYGIAAGNDPDEENRVYAGLSTDREQAKLLSNQLKAEGVDLYVREVDLPAATSLHFNGDAEAVNQYFQVSADLVALLSQTSASLLGKDLPGKIGTEDMSRLTDLHRQWTEAAKPFQAGLGADQQEMGRQLEQAMNSSLSSVEEYNKNTAKGHLWEIQSRMMEFILLQKQLVASLEKA
ncbi:hypothetical protein BCV73_20410 [Paenibacillus sp. SSG-1]|uniref:SPOR domain-containing protein n=1 Tax=Paenibacillus sp. SSG-1 TaxID=1443669 RepID=UPI000B7C9A00|nr:SPOR domain-containing protein [Paenibacillus sp. SSG-1]OXL85192.1 hypothetical protein BCV73_20410 [Paenibacillus sp. SSG-1]